jgi:flagellar motor switch protein FliG
VAGLAAVAGILQAAEGRTGVQILENLAAHDHALAERLCPPQVAFDDLADAAPGVLQAMIEKSDRDVLLTALIGAVPPVVKLVLDRLPPLEAQQARRQINHPGPIRLSDVEEARRQIARLAQHEMLHVHKRQEAASLELGT